MPLNRIALIGHNGWSGRPITNALAATGAPLRILYRAGSDISSLPAGVQPVQIDWEDEESFVPALSDVDVLISVVGHGIALEQKKIIPALIRNKVKLFVPTDLALPYTHEERRDIPVPHDKEEVEHALKAAGVPFVVMLAGNFAEFAIGTPALGIDVPNNRLVLTADAENQPLHICTLPYVAAAFASLFVSTPLEALEGRTIGLNEFVATGAQIRAALESKNGAQPRTVTVSVQDANNAISSKNPLSLAYLVRKKWGTGTHTVGNDVWDVPSYPKKTLDEFVHEGAGEFRYSSFLDWIDCNHLLDQYFE